MMPVTPRDLYASCDRMVGADYPPKFLRVPNPVAGPGFFPVMSGSFHDGDLGHPIGRRPLLFVGQDWGCESDLAAVDQDSDADLKTGTSRRLNALLRQANIPLEDCFFSNALWGVRAGRLNTGPSPGWSDDRFVQRCQAALCRQIKVLRPRAIVCLGRFAPRLLARIHPECAIWNSTGTIAQIDECGVRLISLRAPFDSSVRKLALLVHRCYRHVNVGRRRFGSAEGNDAEIAILQPC